MKRSTYLFMNTADSSGYDLIFVIHEIYKAIQCRFLKTIQGNVFKYMFAADHLIGNKHSARGLKSNLRKVE